MPKKKTVRPRRTPVRDPDSFNIFICWSGERSRLVASALHSWLRKVNNYARPWMSSEDIDKGTRWVLELAKQLSELRFGIVCLTAENLASPWVLFEAGAMSRHFEDSWVSPYLLDLTNSEVKRPLADFQMTIAQKDDTKRLVFSINRALGNPLDDRLLEESFEQWWPRLEEKLNQIPPASETAPSRPPEEILEEILDHVREIKRASSAQQAPIRLAEAVRLLNNNYPIQDSLWAKPILQSPWAPPVTTNFKWGVDAPAEKLFNYLAGTDPDTPEPGQRNPQKKK